VKPADLVEGRNVDERRERLVRRALVDLTVWQHHYRDVGELEDLREAIRAVCAKWRVPVDLDWVPAGPHRVFTQVRHGQEIRIYAMRGAEITFGDIDRIADELAQIPEGQEKPDPPAPIPVLGGTREAYFFSRKEIRERDPKYDAPDMWGIAMPATRKARRRRKKNAPRRREWKPW
jgi:hypothetical protein